MNLHHVALRVLDPDRAARFYRDLLGLPELARHTSDDGASRAIWLSAGATILMLERTLRGRGPDSGSAHVLSFLVDDLAAWEQRLATTPYPIDDRTPFTLFVSDPDGHRVGLTVYPTPEA